MLFNKTKIFNSNKKMNDWRRQLAEDLKIASNNVKKMNRKVFSFDAVISEFKRVAHKDIMIANYTIGIDLSGVYFLDNNKNQNYLFLIIKTDELIPVDNNTRNWDEITVNDYLISLLENIINNQLEQLSFEFKSNERRQKEISKEIDRTVDYLNKSAARYKEVIKAGNRTTDYVKPINSDDIENGNQAVEGDE